MSRRNTYVHDDECALTTEGRNDPPDWNDPNYKPPKCTCRARQKARTDAFIHPSCDRSGYEAGCGSSLGNGNYVKLPHKIGGA